MGNIFGKVFDRLFKKEGEYLYYSWGFKFISLVSASRQRNSRFVLETPPGIWAQ